MAATAQFRLGLVGLGEVGFSLARGLRRAGLAEVCAFDKAAAGDGALAALVRGRAEEAGIALVSDAGEVAGRSDVILGLTPGSQSAASADALVPHLRAHHLYVDLASATPTVKRDALARLAASGARLADGSIMGSPVLDGIAVEIIVSGPAARQTCDLLVPWGMNVAAVGEAIGAASGIKIFRSVIAKGLEALLVECLLGTEPLGISAEVLASYGRFLDPRPFTEIANFLVATDVIHAERRAQEAEMAAQALREAGIDPVMTRATVARLRSVADLDLRTELGGRVPGHYADAIAAVARRLPGRAEPA